jgi:hypothetical protein
MRSSFHKAGRERRTRRSRSFFKATRLRNALNFSESVPIASSSATNAVDYAKFRGRSCRAVIRVYDAAGNVIETHEHAGDFKEPLRAKQKAHTLKRDG